jgi:hypothetical protein
MYQRPIMLVPISGNGFRPSLFESSVVQGTGFHPTLSGGYWLGLTGQEWYLRAKTAVAKFDNLLTRTAKIASKTERDNIMAWVGTAATDTTPAYRYAAVKSDLGDVETSTPPGVSNYETERRQNRITKLEDFNKEFETKVVNAETVHGRLTEPAVIQRESILTPGAAPTGTNWTLPILVGAGALGIALVVTLIKG